MSRERQTITTEDVGTVDALQIVLDGPKGALVEDHSAPHYPCPKCRSVSKEHHGPGERICFNKQCRHVFQTKDVKAQYKGAEGPRFPCPSCGKETKEHHTPAGSRICSSAACRKVYGP